MFVFSQGIGEVVSTGSECTHLLGQAVGYMKYGAFAEYVVSLCNMFNIEI